MRLGLGLGVRKRPGGAAAFTAFDLPALTTASASLIGARSTRKRLLSAYGTGNAYTFIQATGGATNTLPFQDTAVSNDVDFTNLDAVNNNTARISQINDQSGNAYNATQGTAARRFRVRNGRRDEAICDDASGPKAAFASETVARNGCTYFWIGGVSGDTNTTLKSHGTASANYIGLLADPVGLQSLGSAFRAVNAGGFVGRHIICMVCGTGANSSAIYVNDISRKYAFTAHSYTADAVGGELGSMVTASTTFRHSLGHYEADLTIDKAINETDVQAYMVDLRDEFEVAHNPIGQIILVGDSRTYGQGATDANTWAYQLANSGFNEEYDIINQGVSAQTAGTINTNVTRVTNKFRSGINNIVIYLAGDADIDAGTTAATLTGGGGAVSSFINTVVTALNALPGGSANNKLIMCTGPAISNTGTFSAADTTEKLTLEQWLRDNAAGLGFTVCDIAAGPLGTHGAGLFGDDRHENQAGHNQHFTEVQTTVVSTGLATAA